MIIPSNFYGDPLGHGSNQSGHILLGLTFQYWFAYAVGAIIGVLPPVELGAILWAVIYLLIEFSQRGGKNFDKIEDIQISIMYPVILAVIAQRVLQHYPEFFQVLLWFFVPYTIQIGIVGMGVRYWQARKEGRDI